MVNQRRRGMLLGTGLAAMLGAAVVVAIAVLVPPPADPTAVVPTPSGSSSPTVSPSPSPVTTPSPSPSATVGATPTGVATAGAFVNAQLGYRLEVPPPWHRADCGSFELRSFGADRDARDEFIPIREYDYLPTGTGAAVDSISVFARSNPGGLTPRAWEQAGKIGFSTGRVLDDVTFAGRPALKVGGNIEFELYLVADGAFMFEVAHAGPGRQTSAASRSAIVHTFRFLTPDELRAARAVPTSTPPAPRTPEEVADALTEGFARRDIAVLRQVLTPGCVSHGFAQSGGTGMDDTRYLDELRGRFAQGLEVTVQPRPLTGDRTGSLPTVHARSTWREPGQADRDVDLMISPEGATGATWYWRGTVTYPPGSR